MNISGVVVTVKPEDIESVVSELDKMEGVEVYESFRKEGKIIVVIEEENTAKEVSKFKEIHDLPGVITVSMAYHHFEDEVETRPAGDASRKLAELSGKLLN